MMRTGKLLITAFFISLCAAAARAEETVVADFNSGMNPVNWKADAFISGAGGEVGITTGTAVGEAAYNWLNHTPGLGYSMKIAWSGVDSVNEFGGGVIADSMTPVNITACDALSFWIYTPNANTNISVGIMMEPDPDYISAYVQLQDYLVTGANVWQNVVIPISDMTRNAPSIDLTRITEIKWMSEFSRSNDASGTIYIDDVSLCTLSHAPGGTKIFTGGDKGVAGDADVPGDTVISYLPSWGGVTSTSTVALTIPVSPGYGASWTSAPADKATLELGTTIYFAHRIRNDGNSVDKMTLTAQKLTAFEWPVTLFWDKDKSGTYTPNDLPWSNTIGLVPESTYYFLTGVYLPPEAVSGSSTTVRVTARDNNGSGANDLWPTAVNDDTITDDFTLYFDSRPTSPPAIAVLVEPQSRVMLTAPGALNIPFAASVTMPDGSPAPEVSFVYQINASVAVATNTVTLSGTSTYSSTVAVSGTCSLTYSWRAVNPLGYTAQTSSRTVFVSRLVTAENFSSGTLSLDDDNTGGGRTSVLVPAGALENPVTLTMARVNRTDPEIRSAGSPAASALPSTVCDFGPDGTVFKKPVTLTLVYADDDNDNIEDTTGKDARTMRLFWWDGFDWRMIGGRVDLAKKTVTVQVMHFSRYGAFPINTPSDADFRPKERIITPAGSPGKNDFAQFGVSSDFVINIFNIKGAKVRSLTESNIWKGEDDDGNIVESGLYVYQIKTQGKVVSGTIVVAK